MTVFSLEPEAGELGPDAAENHVDPADHPEVALDHGLVFLGRIESPAPARPAHGVLQEGGLGVVVFRSGRLGDRDVDVPVQAVHGGRPEILLRVVVVGVRRPGAPDAAEGLSRPDAAQEVDDRLTLDFGLVPFDAGDRLDVGQAVEVQEVEHPLPGAVLDRHAELADEAGAVAGPAEQGRIADVGEGAREGRLGEGVGVGPLVSSAEDAGPAGGADRGRDEGPVEPDSVPGQGIRVRRPDDRVAGAAQGVEALVVGQDEEDVGRDRRSGSRKPPRPEGQGSQAGGRSPEELAARERCHAVTCLSACPFACRSRSPGRGRPRWPGG